MLRFSRPMAAVTALLLPATPLLAQTAKDRAHQKMLDIYFWLGVIIAVVAVMVITAVLYRRRLASEDEGRDSGVLLLSDIRRMHAEGQIGDEEFARLKGRVIAESRASLDGGGDEGPDQDSETSDDNPASEL